MLPWQGSCYINGAGDQGFSYINGAVAKDRVTKMILWKLRKRLKFGQTDK